jgi:hypothetical protein
MHVILTDKKNKSAEAQRKCVDFARVERRIIRMRVIMTAENCSPAVASHRANYVDDFRVPTLLGAQPRPNNTF